MMRKDRNDEEKEKEKKKRTLYGILSKVSFAYKFCGHVL
jgi:hypothetical protein